MMSFYKTILDIIAIALLFSASLNNRNPIIYKELTKKWWVIVLKIWIALVILKHT